MKDSSIHSNSAKKPLVPSYVLREIDESEDEWQQEAEDSQTSTSRRGIFGSVNSFFSNTWQHASRRKPSRDSVFLGARSTAKKCYGAICHGRIKKAYIYVLFLAMLLLGTVICFGVHLAHERHGNRKDGHGTLPQRSHSHRYIKGDCRQCLDNGEKESPALVIIQANDIYEMGPYIYQGNNSTTIKDDALAATESGGLSKFLALKRSYEKIYGRQKVMAVLSGDYLSPSALSTAKMSTADIVAVQEKYGLKSAEDRGFVESKSPKSSVGSLAGAHMISVGNKIFDLATFGNHEFDLSKKDLHRRVGESWFPWLASNLVIRGNTTRNVFKYRIKTLKAPWKSAESQGGADRLRIGFISATMEEFPAPSYVRIMNSTETRREIVRLTRFLRSEKSVDFVILLTHQSISTDVALIKAFEESDAETCSNGVNLVLGGHEHESSYGVIGTCAVPLTKSFYNAKAVYVHKIFADGSVTDGASNFHVESIFVPLDNACPQDDGLNQEIMQWWSLAAEAFLADDLDLKKSVAYLPEKHDLRNDVIYNERNPMTEHIGNALTFCAGPGPVDGAVFNCGAIRLDNFIGPGVFTVYDVIRVWPFPDPIELATVDGATLRRVIQMSTTMNRGTHGFLQLSAEFSDDCMADPKDGQNCTVGGKPIADDREYTIALPVFLLEGKQENLEFLKQFRAEPNERKALRESDVRHCLTTYLPNHFPMP